MSDLQQAIYHSVHSELTFNFNQVPMDVMISLEKLVLEHGFDAFFLAARDVQQQLISSVAQDEMAATRLEYLQLACQRLGQQQQRLMPKSLS